MDGAFGDGFKCELDKFLGGVPDQPTVPGRSRAAIINSLLDTTSADLLSFDTFIGWQP